MHWKGRHVFLTCAYASTRRDAKGNVTASGSISDSTKRKKGQDIELTDVKGWMLVIKATAHCMLTKPSFSNYVVPYILTVVAILGAVCTG